MSDPGQERIDALLQRLRETVLELRSELDGCGYGAGTDRRDAHTAARHLSCATGGRSPLSHAGRNDAGRRRAVDAQLRTTYVNPRLIEMLGYPAAEILGHSPLRLHSNLVVRKCNGIFNNGHKAP